MTVIFGDPKVFAIEAMTEPGPNYPAMVGSNIAGRIRLHLGGHVFGNFSEPCCVLGCLSDHLAEICSSPVQWHEALSGLSPFEQFQLLDDLLYGNSDATPLGNALDACVFLTNQSEAFEGIKAFVVLPPGTNFTILVETRESVQSFCVPVTDFREASRKFADWLELKSQALDPAHTGTAT